MSKWRQRGTTAGVIALLLAQLGLLTSQVRARGGGPTRLESAALRLVAPVARMVSGTIDLAKTTGDGFKSSESLREEVSRLERGGLRAAHGEAAPAVARRSGGASLQRARIPGSVRGPGPPRRRGVHRSHLLAADAVPVHAGAAGGSRERGRLGRRPGRPRHPDRGLVRQGAARHRPRFRRRAR